MAAATIEGNETRDSVETVLHGTKRANQIDGQASTNSETLQRRKLDRVVERHLAYALPRRRDRNGLESALSRWVTIATAEDTCLLRAMLPYVAGPPSYLRGQAVGYE